MPERRPYGQSEADRQRDKRLLGEWISEADTLDRRLIQAVSDGDLHTVQVLLDRLDREEGPDPCARVDAEDHDSVLRGNVLHLAIQQGELKIVRSLLRAGAVADAVLTVADRGTMLKGTALHLAVERGNLKIVQALLDDGADPNALMAKIAGDSEFKGTALHSATALRHPGIVEALLAAGARSEIQSNLGKTALQMARDGNAREIVAILEVVEAKRPSQHSPIQHKHPCL